ncbi:MULTISPECIES: fluoride efflux transporter CrcB [Neobacillus]|nr:MULTISPECIES: fluoride efflux transporter CrcB [Neobacillus]
MEMVYLAVGCGGVIGAVFRFLLDGLISRTALPLSSGILFVNMIGCFIIGFTLSLNPNRFSSLFKLGFVTGFLGSFTTFSSFSVKTIELFLKWGIQPSIVYLALTIIAGYGSVKIGRVIALKIEKG